MVAELHVLLVEDSEVDALLVRRALERHGCTIHHARVETEEELNRRLHESWDVVLADYQLPGFSGLRALEIVRAHDPDLPFILVSGTIGEERAAAIISAGANDYLLKDNLMRLGPTVERVLRDAEIGRQRRRVQQALQHSEERFRAIFEHAALGIALSDTEGRIVAGNPAFAAMIGYDSDELVGRHLATFTHPDDLPVQAALHEDMIFGARDSYRLEKRYLCKDGSLLCANVTVSVIRGDDGRIQNMVAMIEDITERKRSEEALRESEERYRTLVETSIDGVCLIDQEARIQFANNRLAEILGFGSPTELVGRPSLAMIAAEDVELARSELQGVLERGTTADVRLRAIRHDGSVFPIQVNGRLIRAVDGTPAGITAVIRDVSAQVEYERELRHLALHDALTGLPNRTLLLDRLGHALSLAERDNQSIALLLMDLDRFKEVNDTHGHPLGDRVLQEVARRLTGAIRTCDTVARLGGDEFAVMLSDTDLVGAIEVATKLTAALDAPIAFGEQRFHVGVSIGIALAPDHGDAPETLLRRADVAMYVAKRTNSGYAAYTPDQDSYSPLRLVIISELREAIGNDQLVLHFQPKLNLKTGLIESVEALVRWAHPAHGIIPPDQFISVAEHSGLIRRLTAWVIRRALEQCRVWRDSGYDLGVAVNLSAPSLHDPDIVQTMAQSLADSGVPASRLTVEITESTLMTEPERAMAVLLRLKDLGMRISIDDFGTGYSSLSYLRQLQVDELKIDKSFVLDVDTNSDSAFIIQAILDLGHNFGLDVVAEGVENERALEKLRAFGGDWVQGYHLCRPLSGPAITRWLNEQPHIRTVSGPIVIIEDDSAVREALAKLLSDTGYPVVSLADARRIHDGFMPRVPGLFLIDLMLQEVSGIELAREMLRERFPDTPRIGISASNLMVGLARESGVFQAVLAKPCEAETLVATIAQVLRTTAA